MIAKCLSASALVSKQDNYHTEFFISLCVNFEWPTIFRFPPSRPRKDTTPQFAWLIPVNMPYLALNLSASFVSVKERNHGICICIFMAVESSPLLKNSLFLKREQFEGGSDILHCGNGQVLFKDYLKQQIDHLMTGDAGRDGLAEGRRGTHVEVGRRF